MKKNTMAIGVLLLTMNCFSQTDTLAYRIVSKGKHEFNYHSKELKATVKPKSYKDFEFKLRDSEFLYIDLFDYMEPDTLYLLYRAVTAYYRDGEVENLYFKSNKNTLWIDGSLVKKVIVHKPELK
tara:strand:+ start:142 stop:516 length:375 start_codon:yes stop_codon:yes gene_type:complete